MDGAGPKKRWYARLNCDALSYPTTKAACVAFCISISLRFSEAHGRMVVQRSYGRHFVLDLHSRIVVLVDA